MYMVQKDLSKLKLNYNFFYNNLVCFVRVGKGQSSSYLKHWSPVDINSVVVHHLNNGHTKVAADAEGDAETQAAEDGNDVAFGQTTAATVQQWGRTWCRCHWTPILSQFNVVLFFYIATIYFPEETNKAL